MALDLVRRAALKNRFDLIPRIERLSSVDWRRSDPWLAIRVAEATHDIPGALRSAGFLPAAIVVEAREAIAARSGDKALLRSLLLAHATADPAARRAIAERLLAIGARDDAVALLEADAVASGAPHGEALDRLLYLWGPRLPQPALDWLRSRIAEATSEADQLAWLTLYVRRDRPTRALRMLETSPLGDRTDMLIERLTLAGHLFDAAAANRALLRLLDGRQLLPASLAQISAQLPRSAGRSQRLALARRRLEAGVAVANDRMDLAWDARERGDFPAASAFAQQQLRTKPRDVDALRLLADISRGPDEKIWTRRALAALPDAPASLRTRAELLGRLGQMTDALVAIEQARRMKPDDKSLVALQARLLIQAGKPGRAQALFEQ
jgi:tetratricopeptide (TPR) repeat protein